MPCACSSVILRIIRPCFAHLRMYGFMVRLLTLWFDYGHWPEVYEALVEGIKTIQIDTWLQVIPQLIARIDTPRQLVGRLIHQLLTDIGKHHPQVLVLLLLLFVNDSHEVNSGALEDKEKNKLKQCQYLENFNNNTNLILETAQCMIYQVLSLFYLLLFPPPAENRCSPA